MRVCLYSLILISLRCGRAMTELAAWRSVQCAGMCVCERER
uniref:Uncharacterized protein n=1 Tax=Setaria viridis TaxID=4556 RepID=A0A4V6Y7N2_SETVI|nr:hypothetical protein SEVIR_9G066120v2 [Setaria viridis]